MKINRTVLVLGNYTPVSQYVDGLPMLHDEHVITL